MAIVQASSLLNYIIGMAIAFAVAFALSDAEIQNGR
jgi:PTS system sucrose-specific IIC component